MLLCLGLKGQNNNIKVTLYRDSVSTEISTFSILAIHELEKENNFNGIADKWTHILTFEFESKTYEIPIDKRVSTITIYDNPNSDGFCNRITYWSSTCTVTISEHGNGCTYMNEVEINGGNSQETIIKIDGIRKIPLNYETDN